MAKSRATKQTLRPHGGVRPQPLTPAEVRAEFLELTDGGSRIHCVGTARANPKRLLGLGYVPHSRIDLFGLRYYLSDTCKNEDVRFVVAYIAMPAAPGKPPSVYARFFYKDGSLLWRSASHFARSARENWIGKGDLKLVKEDGHEYYYSAEHTTDLPLELQDAVEECARRTKIVRTDRRALALVVRKSSDTRIVAYRDFTDPRRRAATLRKQLVNGGKPIARFTRTGDPRSLVFVRGFEPDFSRESLLDVSTSQSRLYEGRIERYRILSKNGLVQYLFFLAPRLAWLGYPQSMTTDLSSYGVRTIDVVVPDDLVVPGMEYHYLETADPPVWMSQIPAGFAGPASPVDPWRADASAWLEQLQVVRDFRRSRGAERPG